MLWEIYGLKMRFWENEGQTWAKNKGKKEIVTLYKQQERYNHLCYRITEKDKDKRE